MTCQSDKKPATRGNRSKLGVSSPSTSRYQLARSSVADDDDLRFSRLDAGRGISSPLGASESINLQAYDSQAAGQGPSNDVQETSYILDERPPVEGRDSLIKDKDDSESKPKQQNINDDLHSASYVPPYRSNIATVRELQRGARPSVEPLPLLQHGSTADLESPGFHNVSPFTEKQLFTDEKLHSPLSDIVADDANVDLEYDDYMPQLPGSYFTMDPQAYTLTWSKQPSSWTHQPDISRTASDASVDRSVVKGEQY